LSPELDDMDLSTFTESSQTSQANCEMLNKA
jgi:hypothetical protein